MKKSPSNPSAFFCHLGKRFRKTADALRNFGKLESLYNKLFNPTDVGIVAENVMQKATFKAREKVIDEIIEKAKEEALVAQEPAVTSPLEI